MNENTTPNEIADKAAESTAGIVQPYLSTPERFFYDNAGFSYMTVEDAEAGHIRCARALARAEKCASNLGHSFTWATDGFTNREWTDEGEETPTWMCVERNSEGTVVACLSGIDFGDNEPWGQPYRRVVEAELAMEALS